MTPLNHLPPRAWARVQGVFTDIDDTLTTEGAITPDALQALADLRAAGLTVIAVTGRPVGWSEPFALAWPIDAIVAENGAVALTRAAQDLCTLQKTYQTDATTRAANFTRLQAVAARVLREVPGTALAQDSPGRETDIAIDHSEFTHLPPEQIEHVLQLMRSQGLHATVSSIHINAWIGAHDKWQGACWAARTLWGIDLAATIDRWVYVGDSSNDQVMFEHFTHSVGVANIQRFVPQLTHRPRYVTHGQRGAGFAELAACLLAHTGVKSVSTPCDAQPVQTSMIAADA